MVARNFLAAEIMELQHTYDKNKDQNGQAFSQSKALNVSAIVSKVLYFFHVYALYQSVYALSNINVYTVYTLCIIG